MATHKSYDSIIPSAKSLLLMKGYTDIPFAREAASMLQGAEIFDLSFDENDFWFWIRVMHFELRYKSIDQLLEQAAGSNILELSSGYSLRGLARCSTQPELHYIDTDLDAVIETKRHLVDALLPAGRPEKLELLPLNALDGAAFEQVLRRFEPGPVTIINEGLLMYLDSAEKAQLCRTIRSVLQARGGSWITADVYVRRTEEMQAGLPQSASERAFSEQHRIEQNKFASYDEARAFFREQGFEVVREAVPDYAALSMMPQLQRVLPEAVRNSTEPPPKIQATWQLRVAV